MKWRTPATSPEDAQVCAFIVTSTAARFTHEVERSAPLCRRRARFLAKRKMTSWRRVVTSTEDAKRRSGGIWYTLAAIANERRDFHYCMVRFLDYADVARSARNDSETAFCPKRQVNTRLFTQNRFFCFHFGDKSRSEACKFRGRKRKNSE